MAEEKQMPLVYCSRHGDIERTLSVLLEIADEQTVSPMQFSLAVHNAISGVLSIQQKNRSAISALVADNGGVVPVLLEAAGFIAENRSDSVLCLISDVRLPEIYRDENTPPDFAFAISLIISRDEGVPVSLKLIDRAGDCDSKSELNCTPIELIQFLDSDHSHMDMVENGSIWRLQKI